MKDVGTKYQEFWVSRFGAEIPLHLAKIFVQLFDILNYALIKLLM